jgi:biopolymer transport protein ExbD
MDRQGQLSWNGMAVSDGQLTALLKEVALRDDQPEVHFRPDASARYARVDQILAIAAGSGATSFGFAGNEQYAQAF